jgi:thiamine-phosphate pyrophosphorylase
LNSRHPLPAFGLYAITAEQRSDLFDIAAQVLEGGARMLQYRDQSTDASRRAEEAAALKQLCQTHAALLIIDHDVALARSIGADGVHLGGEDDLHAARAALGATAVIGVSCGDSLNRAKVAARAGADYISFGAFFPSPTKPLAPRAPIDLLRQSAALGIPRVAIGGITPDNAGALVEAGAEFLAAISSLFGAADARAAASRFVQLYPSHSGTPA